jgi:hypothetical protein
MNPFRTHRLPGQTGKHALPARGLVVYLKALLFLALLPALALGQGLVNVNNRGLSPQQLVLGPSGSPLTGTNYVAQIVYGSNPSSMTNILGGPMRFRVPTTVFPGTWNPPGSNGASTGIRVLQGFVTGQTVWMKVRVWDFELSTSWEDVSEWIAEGTGDILYGESTPFSYIVGDESNPSSLAISNFRGFAVLVTGCASGPGSCRPPTCYASITNIVVELHWNGAATNINLLPQLTQYRPAVPSVGLNNFRPETPVQVLFENATLPAEATRLCEISGTLGSALITIKSNVLGEVTLPVSASLGFRPFRYFGASVCGVRPGNLVLRVVPIRRPGRLTLEFAPLEQFQLRVSGTPAARYTVLISEDMSTFRAIWTPTTGMDGNSPRLLMFLPEADSNRMRFFRLDGLAE